jgi:hypothetical protein
VANGRDVTEDANMNEFEGNPLRREGVGIGFDPDPDDDNAEYKHIVFTADTLVKVDAQKGLFVFEDKGIKMTLTKAPVKYFNFDAF